MDGEDEAGDAIAVFKPCLRDHALMSDMRALAAHSPKGIYVMPAFDSMQQWFGVVFVRSGVYAEGIFRFRMFFGDGYPNAWPAVRFISQVFHPQIDGDNGYLAPPQEWKEPVRLWTVLEHIHHHMYAIEVDNATNYDAAQQYLNNRDLFYANAIRSVKESLDRRYLNPTEPANSLKFSEWRPETHQRYAVALREGKPFDDVEGPTLMDIARSELSRLFTG
eukprot:Opistho-1_new@75079